MKSFSRALRMALRYRWSCLGTVGCALAVAILWGGNIGAIFPLVEVLFKGQSLQQWVAKEIARAETKADELRAEIVRIEREIPTADGERRTQLETDRNLAVTRLDAEQRAVARYRWLAPPIRRFIPSDPFLTLLLLVVLIWVFSLVKNVFVAANTILAVRVSQLATFDLRKEFFRRTLRLDVGTFTTDGAGELLSRFTYDMENATDGLNVVFGKFIREPLKMVACLIGAAYISWRLLLLSLFVAPLAALVIDRLAKALKQANRRAMQEMSQIFGILEETFQGIKVVKAFTMERAERRRFHARSKQFFKKSMRIVRYEALSRPTMEMVGILIICVALLSGAWLVLKGETHLLGIRMSDRPLTLSTLLVFYGLMAGCADPGRKLSDLFGKLQKTDASCERIFTLLDREPAVCDPAAPRPLPRHHREIEFQGIQFSYVPTRPVLIDLDLRVPYGETIAIVGPNGCGKSTLVNLLPRFFDPNAGRVLLDGVDLREARIRNLRAQIGLVTQETLLFDDTVFNNIRYGSPNATRDDVVRAAQQAHAHRFIEDKLEHGYDTVVGAAGNLLSGGQRQRIALARAILRDPAILILDEATSQIDLESEQLIHKVLEEFTRDRTTLLITHRLGTLSLADRIVVMNAGRILDIGKHDELLRRCELYRRLHDIQFRQTG